MALVYPIDIYTLVHMYTLARLLARSLTHVLTHSVTYPPTHTPTHPPIRPSVRLSPIRKLLILTLSPIARRDERLGYRHFVLQPCRYFQATKSYTILIVDGKQLILKRLFFFFYI